MRLEEDNIATPFAVRPTEEMIEADLENLGGGSVARDMSAKLAVGRVSAHDHRQRIPANDRRDAVLHFDVAGICALLFERDGVPVRAEGEYVGYDAKILRLAVERRQKEFGALAASHAKDGLERVEPLGSLGRIAVAGRGRIVEGQGWIDPLEHAAAPLSIA